MATSTIADETTGGEAVKTDTFPVVRARMTARELIRARVAREVRDHNAALALGRVGPASPVATERLLTLGTAYGRYRWLDWETECARALMAFQRGGISVLVDRRPVADSDEEIEIRPETSVSFVRLVRRPARVA